MLAILSASATRKAPRPRKSAGTIVAMKNETLADLYKVRPQARAEIAAAPGYAVFSNANVNIIFASFSGGYGVVDAKSGRQTYMNMGEAGIGPGSA